MISIVRPKFEISEDDHPYSAGTTVRAVRSRFNSATANLSGEVVTTTCLSPLRTGLELSITT